MPMQTGPNYNPETMPHLHQTRISKWTDICEKRINDKDTQTELGTPNVYLHKNKTHVHSSPQLDSENEEMQGTISITEEKNADGTDLGP